MIQVRTSLIVTVAWFIVLFNAERLGIGLSTALYLTTILLAAGLLFFPNFAHIRLPLGVLGVLGIYFGIAVLFNDRPIALTWRLAEMGILFIGFAMMRKVSQALLDFEIAVQDFVIDVRNSRMIPYHEGQERLMEELQRARRYERPLAVIYAKCDPGDAKITEITKSAWDWRIDRTLKAQFIQLRLAQTAELLTYKSDAIIKYSHDLVITLPETGFDDADVFAQQFVQFARNLHQLDPQIGIAVFPEDGLVAEDLIDCAKKRAENLPTDLTPDTGRSSDVMVNTDQRLQIERNAAWVNRMAYQSPSARAIYNFLKRAFEVLLILAVMPVALPLMAVVALLIYLDDGGPILYFQPRTGYKGKRFKIYKFRTMQAGAPSQPAQQIRDANGKIRYLWPEKTHHDPRITKLGRILRKTSLDELPQLLNVLKGDMSLVGPRPTSWDLDKYTLQQTERLMVRPGITGLWQVCSRESTNFDERLLWDLKYIDKMSLSLDLQIIFRTVGQVFKKGGA